MSADSSGQPQAAVAEVATYVYDDRIRVLLGGAATPASEEDGSGSTQPRDDPHAKLAEVLLFSFYATDALYSMRHDEVGLFERRGKKTLHELVSAMLLYTDSSPNQLLAIKRLDERAEQLEQAAKETDDRELATTLQNLAQIRRNLLPPADVRLYREDEQVGSRPRVFRGVLSYPSSLRWDNPVDYGGDADGFTLSDKGWQFAFKKKGYWLRSEPPTKDRAKALLTLLGFLSQRRKSDAEYLARLARAATAVGLLAASGKVNLRRLWLARRLAADLAFTDDWEGWEQITASFSQDD